MRKSPTTTFGTLSPKRESGQNLNLTSPYQRSDSLPANQLHSSNGSKAPSWSVRMQLEEKRRQIENQKMAEKSEKFKQIRDTSKEAFLTLYGKKQPSPAAKPPAGSPTGAAAKLIRPMSTPNRSQKQNSEHESRSLKDYDEISKSILEIKEQMKRLSVEQEKLQNLVVQPSPTTAAAPQQQQSQFAIGKASSSFHLNVASPQTPSNPVLKSGNYIFF